METRFGRKHLLVLGFAESTFGAICKMKSYFYSDEVSEKLCFHFFRKFSLPNFLIMSLVKREMTIMFLPKGCLCFFPKRCLCRHSVCYAPVHTNSINLTQITKGACGKHPISVAKGELRIQLAFPWLAPVWSFICWLAVVTRGIANYIWIFGNAPFNFISKKDLVLMLFTSDMFNNLEMENFPTGKTNNLFTFPPCPCKSNFWISLFENAKWKVASLVDKVKKWEVCIFFLESFLFPNCWSCHW